MVGGIGGAVLQGQLTSGVQGDSVLLGGLVDIDALQEAFLISAVIIVISGQTGDEALAGVVLDLSIGLGHDEHDGHHAVGLAVPVSINIVIGTSGANLHRRSILDAGVSGEIVDVIALLSDSGRTAESEGSRSGLVIIGIRDHKHGGAVGIERALIGHNTSLVVVHLEGGIILRRLRLSSGQSLQGVLAVIVHLVGDDLSGNHVLLGVVVLVGGDDLGGAVGEQQLNAVAQVPVSTALDVQDQSVIADLLNFLDIDHVAVSVHIDGVVLLHGHVAQVLAADLSGSLIAGAIDGQSLLAIVVGVAVLSNGDSAFHLGSSGNRLDLLLLQGVGVQNIIVNLELVIGLELVLEVGNNGTLGGHNHIGVLLVGSLDGLVDGADVGVDLGDDDGIVVIIVEDLGQNAVIAVLVLVITLGDVASGLRSVLNAVNIDGDLLGRDALAQAQILVDVADLDLLGVLC